MRLDVTARRETAPSLVGREPEESRLRAFVATARQAGSALIVTGDAGLGKSALLEETVRHARATGVRAMAVVGTEFSANEPFSALAHLIDPLLSEPGLLSQVQERALAIVFGTCTGPPPSPMLVSTAALSAVRRASLATPLLIAVDDAHWLDGASAEVLAFVARRLHGSAAGLLAASRPSIGPLSAHGGVPVLYLTRLTDDAARDLLASRFPDLSVQVRERLVAEAEGNPLALVELPLVLVGEQRACHEALPVVLPMTDRLRALFETRIADLPAETLRLLLVLALDDSGNPQLLRRATGLDVHETLRPAQAAGLVTVHPLDGYASFTHPLVRSAVVARSTDQERRHAHRLVADTVSDQVERRAWHLASAAEGPDAQVAAVLEDAAIRALRRGDARAAQAAMARAVSLSVTQPQRARRLDEFAAFAAEDPASHGTILALLAEALRADPRADASLKAQTVHACLAFNEGDLAGAYRTFTEALRRYGPTADDRSHHHALEILHMVCQFAGSDEMWSGFRQIVAEQGRRGPASLRLAAEIAVHGATPPEALLAELDAAVDYLANEDDPRVIVQVAAAAVAVDHGTGCQVSLRRVLDGGEDAGTTASVALASYLLAEIGLATGNTAEAKSVAADGLAVCRSRDHVPYAMFLRTVLAMSAATSGDRATLAALTEPIFDWAKPAGAHSVLRAAYWALAREALGRSDHACAHSHLAAMAGKEAMESLVDRQPGVLFDLVDATVGSGQPDVARTYLARANTGSLARASHRWEMIAIGAQAMVDDRDPTGQFERAVMLHGAERWPFDLARIRLAYGEHLRRLGAVDSARVQLNRALDTFHILDASPWITRTADQLRGTGEAVIGIGPAREPLTGQEGRIAVLAASGLTNRDIAVRMHLSARTVAGYLQQVFHKMGVTSRAQLRDALTAHRKDLGGADDLSGCSRGAR
jgi:DNA-binding CsgD family transcriptional regulator